MDQLKHLSVCHKYPSTFKISIEISNYTFIKCHCHSPTAKPIVRQAGSKKAALGLWDGKPRTGDLPGADGTALCDWVLDLLGLIGNCRRFISSGSQGLCGAHV